MLTVIEGSKKAVRQDGVIVTSVPVPDSPAAEPTPDEREQKVNELEQLLSGMKHTDAGYTTLAAFRDEHLAALGADTERRATA